MAEHTDSNSNLTILGLETQDRYIHDVWPWFDETYRSAYEHMLDDQQYQLYINMMLISYAVGRDSAKIEMTKKQTEISKHLNAYLASSDRLHKTQSNAIKGLFACVILLLGIIIFL